MRSGTNEACCEDDRVEHVVFKSMSTYCMPRVRSGTNEACCEDDGIARVEVWGYMVRHQNMLE
jgi:hypothetical protein